MFFWNHSKAQNRDLSKELLVYILPDSLEISKQNNPQDNSPKIIVNSKLLQNVISKIGPVEIKKAFPKWEKGDNYRTNRLGIKFRAPAFDRIFVFTFSNPEVLEGAIKQLTQLRAIAFAEKHSNAKPSSNLANNSLIPPIKATTQLKSKSGDPQYDDGTQWHLNNDGRNSGIVGADVKAEAAWSIFTGSTSTRVSVFDTGVELTHDELSGKSFGDSYDPSYADKSHGTVVAGLIAAKGNNGIGGRGLDWNAKLYSTRIFNSGTTAYIGDNNMALAIIDEADNGSHVANHSWTTSSYSSTLAFAFIYSHAMNVVSVAAMGNEGNTTVALPAALNNVLAVGATTNADTRSLFSNYGPHIGVSAPGGSDMDASYDIRNIYTSYTGNAYTYTAGTSFATPLVSGLASLLAGYNSSLSNDDIINIIKLTADDIGSSGWDQDFGHGRINAGNALAALQSPRTVNYYTTSGGTVHSTSGLYATLLYNVPGISDGSYMVKRHEVRKAVTFPSTFCNVFGAWGRSLQSTGLTAGTPNFGEGFTEVVPGTLTSTGATLRTYVYEVFDIYTGAPRGFKPTTTANATFAYTVLGESNNYSISGQDVICSSSNYTIPNLTSTSSVSWSIAPLGMATISGSGNSATVTRIVDGLLTITATITTSCGSKIITKEITLGPPIITPLSYDYGGNTYSPLLPYLTVPNNPVSSINSNVNVNFTLNGATSAYVQPISQSNSPTITHGSWFGLNGGNFYFEFNEPNEWVTFKLTASNACGSSTYDVAFYGPSELGRFAFWPNPASSELKVAFQYNPGVDHSKEGIKNYEVKLLNNQGQTVRSTKNNSLNNEVTFNVSGLPNDIYYLHILDGKKIIKKQVVVRH